MITPKTCLLYGAPMDSGKRRGGCLMGPAAYRTAGIIEALSGLGHTVIDQGDISPAAPSAAPSKNAAVHSLPETIAWTEALSAAAQDGMTKGFPIFMGGDHAISLGTVAGVATHAKAKKRPLYLLWLDAHPDFHTPETTTSGNLHGTPVAYAAGRRGFDGFPKFPEPIHGPRIAMFGIRSVDAAEHAALLEHHVRVHDMRSIDETGIMRPLKAFLTDITTTGGMLHVSLDVDFLEPGIAPAVGTTVPGGTTFREAHLVMELLSESGLVTSLDLVELNPFLDERGRTANLMVDLTASLMGRKVFDRPTRAIGGARP